MSIHQRAADNIRILSVAMVEQAQSGHPGGPMGGADFMHILFSEFLVFDPDDPSWAFRDRFFLDPGHLSAMLYSSLSLIGAYSMDELSAFRQWGSPTPGHPERDITRRIENTSGPLGQGHVFGVGSALAERFLCARFGEWGAHKTYAYISDGGVQEEISQGAGRIAGFLGLSNLVLFFDANDVQLSTRTDVVTMEDTAKKYEAWGWNVLTIDGHDPVAIREALHMANSATEGPTLIIGRTVMGKGTVDDKGNPFEGKVSMHGKPLSKAGGALKETIDNLGGDPSAPFQIFPDVAAYYQEVLEKKRKIVAQRKAAYHNWANAHSGQAKKLETFLSGKVPTLDISSIPFKPNQATRNASANVLAYLAENIENMVVASADLADSDKTEAFLKKTRPFSQGDFGGAFLQAGVSEFTMAAISIGMSLHGGIIPACGTFFVFSDYMKPALRMAALMEQPVKFIWTHDAFRVGEDGPTHQPVEQEAQVRLLEKLHNHHGKSSFLVLRPADTHETHIAWQIALENTQTPTGLILSRQDIVDIPARKGSTRERDAQEARKGAYIVREPDTRPDIVLVANGSEVATLIAGADLLENERGIKVRVVSAPSEGLFREQSPEYQEAILPPSLPTLGLTAGLPVTLQGLVGPGGKVIGLDHFGYSAPYQVLDQKFGFTAENVFQQAIGYLMKNEK